MHVSPRVNDGGLGALLPRIQRFYHVRACVAALQTDRLIIAGQLYCSIAHLCYVHGMVVLRPDIFHQLSLEVRHWSNAQFPSSEPMRGIMLGRVGLVWINKKVE